MAMVEQVEAGPIISRINRLDKVVKHLEEMKGGRSSCWESESSGSPSSPSTCSDGRRSSSSLLDISLKQCRPLHDVVSETQHKGTLLCRLTHLEDRVLQLCLEVEKEMEHHMMISKEEEAPSTPTKKLKQLVKSCVKPKSKSKSKSKSK